MTIPVNLQIFPIGKANRSPHRALDTEGTLRQPQSVSQSSQDVVFHCLGLLCRVEQANRVAATEQGACRSAKPRGASNAHFMLPKLCACPAVYICINLSIGSALRHSGALEEDIRAFCKTSGINCDSLQDNWRDFKLLDK